MRFGVLAVAIIVAILAVGCLEAGQNGYPQQSGVETGLQSSRAPSLPPSSQLNDAQPPADPEKAKLGLAPCGNRKELFSMPPTDMEKVVTMTPVGMMSPPSHVFPAPHMYFFPLDFKSPEDVEIPIYASGNMTLTQIGLRHYNTLGQYENYIDYTLVFSPCTGFDLYFHHLRSLTYPPFIEAAGEILKKCSFGADNNEDYCSGEVSIPIEAGRQFATAGDLKAGVWGFDLGARDYRLEGGTDFANPSRHCDRQGNVFDRCYVVCPFDYFTADILGELKFSGSFGSAGGLGCGGDLYFDVEGTAQGYWFKKGSAKTVFWESDNIYLGPDNLNPSVSAISTGTAVPGLESGLYEFEPQSVGMVNRDFKQVSNDGQVYCYETSSGQQQGNAAILVEITSSATLRVGKHSSRSCGAGPWPFGAYQDFER
ncbi:TPA: hypothetical protein HA231_04480 [Candidatus Woesearchaeota archaeon]|nr:hypothetical protein [Candidatus Woesearchaeota archaeon]